MISATFLLLLLQATGGHSVTLTWTNGNNPAGQTSNVYRATGLCTGTPSFSKIATTLTITTYIDTTVTTGQYCYTVTNVYNNSESVYSPFVNPIVPAFPPSGLAVTEVK